ncbi:MAG: DUF1778 domain-containing protein [Isosphaeraceae bacterium]
MIRLGVTPEQKELIERAAEADGRNQSQFIIYHAVAAARKLLGENQGLIID